MMTKAKLAANQRNAQKSTGPRTPSGKAIAAMNALKHGLCAHTPVVPGEDSAEFATFAAGWVDHLQPSDPHQSSLAEQVILAAWQLRRVPLLRAGLLAREIRRDAQRQEPIHPYAIDADSYVQLSRIDRHQVVLERTFRQCLKELKELQSTDSADYAEEQNEPTGVEVPVNETVTLPGSCGTIPLPRMAHDFSG